MRKVLFLIVDLAVAAAMVVLIVLSEYFNWPGVSTIVSVVLGASIMYLPLPILDLISGWKFDFWRMRLSGRLHDDGYVRISFGYTFRIIIDGYYLLVIDKYGKYQSPGGCYKVSEDEQYYLERKFHACADQKTPKQTLRGVTESSKRDYRMMIPVPKLSGFVRRFHKAKGREKIDNLSREFREELLDTGILDKEVFKSVEYYFRGQYQTSISRSPYFGVDEMLFNDICEVCLTPEQEEFLKGLKARMDERVDETGRPTGECCFVTGDQILVCGMDREKKTGSFIMENAYKITDESFKDLKRCPRTLTKYKVSFDIEPQ